MGSIVAMAAMKAVAHHTSPPVGMALSGIFGSISLVAWICVILPQLFANFKAQSADSLSMAFLIVWLLGDATNLMGALLTHLAPTAIILPSYFCLADLILILQCVYYNTRNRRRAERLAQSGGAEPREDSPLLGRQDSESIAANGNGADATWKDDANEEAEPENGSSGSFVNNLLSLVAVYVIGAAAWFISYKAGAWDTAEPAPDAPDDANNPWEWAGLTLGYISAVCYLCARLPQIWKNYKEKSCEGLSLLFFMLSLTGNLTYGISLVAYSQEQKYLLNALPFLIGSVGTIVEDCVIFVQIRLYGHNKRAVAE